ncbi:hypothetical protein CHLRE_03g177750v5 [Chlamydomonas reinhardtii]|uniref:Protein DETOXIFICATION n=1 Tax=Chlamydomonas reinhardtii TaxID=3055 RepID=A0A2K3DXI7_CHLRE|nr:uncharacterized protein CHLRE_03g177750v5 [Chlamydomonas reinhardtii]PNW85246.1 hypothetical protein CHLRE_03g177750v5 [Chlamydomonas reinhardtii]
MMSFLGPATLIPLGDPLMSLVDTVCIGQFAGTTQLAALGPANLVFSFAQYMFQSLQVASLSLLAGFMRDGRLRRSEEVLSTAVFMAAVLGVATMLLFEAFPEAIITATGVRDMSLLPLSAEYVRLRGLAQPAVLVTMVAQSGLLAQQDSLTPAITVAVSVLVSLVGSVVFVAGLGWGLAGAAITTVACQYVGAIALLFALSKRGKLRIRLTLPRREVLWELLTTMGPLSITYLCKNVSYLFIQTTAATLCTIKLAAHQALFSVWNLLSWTITPFEQAALTYLPGTRGWRKRAGITLLVGLGAVGGVLCGVVLAALACLAPQLFTRDVDVWPHMNNVAALASASMFALGIDVVSSGVNIGMGDAKYVAQSYIITLVALGGFMAVSRAMGWELWGVWCGVVVFFSVRALQSTGRTLWAHLRRGTPEQEAAEEAAAAAAAGEGRRVIQPTLWSTDVDSPDQQSEAAARNSWGTDAVEQLNGSAGSNGAGTGTGAAPESGSGSVVRRAAASPGSFRISPAGMPSQKPAGGSGPASSSGGAAASG